MGHDSTYWAKNGKTYLIASCNCIFYSFDYRGSMINEKLKIDDVFIGWKEEIISGTASLKSFKYKKNARLVDEILSTLKKLSLEIGNDKHNTQKIKCAFAKMGLERFRYSCYTNQIDTSCIRETPKPSHHYFTRREWMFDLIWFEDKEEIGKEYCLKSFPLALESEWELSRSNAKRPGVSYAAVKYDFQKLVVCNARLKVMIFREDAKKGIREMNDYIEYLLNVYKPKPNGRFLCIAYRNDMKSFIYKIFHA